MSRIPPPRWRSAVSPPRTIGCSCRPSPRARRSRGKGCSPNTIHWVVNSTAIARAFVGALSADGAKTWFLLMPDYAIGKAFAADAQRYIKAAGGTVVETVYFPVNNSDFGQFVLRAQASGA